MQHQRPRSSGHSSAKQLSPSQRKKEQDNFEFWGASRDRKTPQFPRLESTQQSLRAGARWGLSQFCWQAPGRLETQKSERSVTRDAGIRVGTWPHPLPLDPSKTGLRQAQILLAWTQAGCFSQRTPGLRGRTPHPASHLRLAAYLGRSRPGQSPPGLQVEGSRAWGAPSWAAGRPGALVLGLSLPGCGSKLGLCLSVAEPLTPIHGAVSSCRKDAPWHFSTHPTQGC